MYFPERIYGLEFEYGVMNQDQYGTFYEANDLEILRSIVQPPRDSVLSGFPRARIWHTNGSCSYVDTGNHPEHATAECLSVRDAIIYAKAGDILMNRIFAYAYSPNKVTHLFKNNLAYNHDPLKGYVTFGCHENYHIASQSLSMHRLIPLLISRQIIDGAGWWHKNPLSDDVCYALSQRGLIIESERSPSTVHNRGILNNKEVNDTGPSPRLHLILGDSNILEFAMYLKLGTVSLVLSLIENEKISHIPSCINSVTALQRITLEGDPFDPCIEGTDACKKSPFEIQTIYLQAAQKELMHGSFASEKTEAELKHIALCWEQALNAIYNRDIKWMMGRFDHVTKKYIIDREVARCRIADPSEEFSLKKNIDIFYHDITNRAWQIRMNAAWPDKRIVTDAEIERAVTE
ncbi:MAG: proteasome accessory factor PafA2 family protein, partial [Patescibacteria group bacterium]